ncbi:hypothetical protein NHX12_005691 [Muraenolepis orangiensis]|uniref:Protein FAM189A1 n=1 Tax=Muraenolepis orangiensis TaxID=630683 RepID=A0A9Q0DTD1_9TELE|nr:hypothetical protein NHX12_005691 [Muraenolepis orangiensis]
MLNLAGSILSCQNAQLVNSLEDCQLLKFDSDGVCVCCELPQHSSSCTNLGETLKLNPLRDCNTIRLRLKTAYLSVQTNYLSVQTAYLSVQTAYLSVQTAYLSVQTAYLSVQTNYSWHIRKVLHRTNQRSSNASSLCLLCYLLDIVWFSQPVASSLEVGPGGSRGDPAGRHPTELLFSVCALNVISTIVCALATAMCCMQMVSADLLQMFMPHRGRALNPDCVTPHGTILHQTLDFDEFIPPIPPPPYYPPEYTCTPSMDAQRGLQLDFPHSPFSAIYGVPINSPGTLYPTDLPPPYESVVGHTPASQVTSSTEQRATESSLCEGTTTGLSTQASVDSASLLVSELADLQDNSSSDDLCSLEVAPGGCSDSSSPASHPEPPDGTGPQDNPDHDAGEEHGPCTVHVCEELASAKHAAEEEAPRAAAASTHALIRARVFSRKLTLPVTLAPPPQPCSPTSLALSGCSPGDRPRGFRAVRKYRKLARMVRSTSDPISCTSTARGEGCDCVPSEKACPGDPDGTSPLEDPAAVLTEPAGLKPGHNRGVRKTADVVGLKPQALRTHTITASAHERPHSLADLKTYKDTKILVAKFLEHSSCSLPPEVQQVVNSIKSVIKSDEKHMEEAIFSANVIDQVMSQSQLSRGMTRKCCHDDIHLQSCGALSSSPSLRRPKRLSCHLLGSPDTTPHTPSDHGVTSRETVL